MRLIDRTGHDVQALQADLGNLLARIHRDGGQYLGEHGLKKAVADADVKIASVYGEVQALQAERDHWFDRAQKLMADHDQSGREVGLQTECARLAAERSLLLEALREIRDFTHRSSQHVVLTKWREVARAIIAKVGGNG
jgi:hypothetical protein